MHYQDFNIAKYSNTKNQVYATHQTGMLSIQKFIESKGFKVACKYNLNEVVLKTVFKEEDGSTAELILTLSYNRKFVPESVGVAYLNGEGNSDKDEVFTATNGYVNRVIRYVSELLEGKTPTVSVDYIQLGITTNFYVREVAVKDNVKYLYLDVAVAGIYKSYELAISVKGTDIGLTVIDEHSGVMVLSCWVDYSEPNIVEVVSILEALVRALAV